MSDTIVELQTLQGWALKLPGLTGSEDCRELDAELHRALFGKPVRKARISRERILENDLPPDASSLEAQVFALNASMDLATFEDWVQEQGQFEVGYFDETTGKMMGGRGSHGYERQDGTYIKKAHLVVVPRYSEALEDALAFKGYFCGNQLSAEIEEVDGLYCSEFSARLLGPDRVVVGRAQHFRAAAAVLGATVDALIRGWRGSGAISVPG